jgi:hypothetical protein
MTDQQDKQVLDLMEKVKKQRKELDAINRPQWKTSCSLALPGTDGRLNLHIVKDLAQLAVARQFLLEHRVAMENASKVWDLDVPQKWQKYDIADWLADIDLRVQVLQVKTKQEKFDKLTKRLDTLLTPEQKRTMELEIIAKELED